MQLYQLPHVFEATVVARPSKQIKSPYLADVCVSADAGGAMCHTPSLGCSGMIAAGARVIVGENANAKCKSKYTLYHVIVPTPDNIGRIVGTHPMVAQAIAGNYLRQTYAAAAGWTWKAECKLPGADNCRWDYVAYDATGALAMVVECKAVPLGDTEDFETSVRKKRGYAQDMDCTSKVALFPDGFRKKATDPVSPRALKHVQALQRLAEEQSAKPRLCMQSRSFVGMLLFVCQRNDCDRFTISKNDPLYRDAVIDAMRAGVIVRCIAVDWVDSGREARLIGELPVVAM